MEKLIITLLSLMLCSAPWAAESHYNLVLEGGRLFIPSNLDYAARSMVLDEFVPQGCWRPPYDESCSNKYDPMRKKSGLRDLLSLTLEPSGEGFGPYGVIGFLERLEPVLDTSKAETCRFHVGCYHLGEDFSLSQRSIQIYAGGGLNYRKALSQNFSMVGSFGIVVQFYRDQEVFSAPHLFRLGLRGEYQLTKEYTLVIGYTHFSNGAQLHIPGGAHPNNSIERLSLGLGYAF